MSKVVTGKARLSYLTVFEARAQEGGEPKFSVCVIIPKSDKVTLDKIKFAIDEAKAEGKTKKWGGKVPANLKTPLRDGDEERGDKEEFANSYFFNASSKMKPLLLDEAGNELMDNSDLYSGCYGRVSVNFYAYDVSGSKGVAVGLNAVKKSADGERLSGGGATAKDFDDDDSEWLR